MKERTEKRAQNPLALAVMLLSHPRTPPGKMEMKPPVPITTVNLPPNPPRHKRIRQVAKDSPVMSRTTNLGTTTRIQKLQGRRELLDEAHVKGTAGE
jgi:hypothetical protein